MKIVRRTLAVLLSFLIAAVAVPHQAAAQIIVGGAASGAASGAAGGVPRIDLSGSKFTPLSPAIDLAPSQASPAIPFVAIPVLPVAAPLAAASVQTFQTVRPIDAAKAPFGQLALVGERLSAAAADGSDKADVLNPFFTGERERAGRLDVSVTAPSAPTPTFEGHATPPTPITLEAMAIDSKAPLAGRQAAVAQLAKFEGAKESLERVSAANPEGGAADYEVHRAALKALAEQGVVMSLRPVSQAHKGELIAGLISKKPASAVFDYDDTLAKFREPISAPVAAGLKASNDAGVKTAILTDRADVKKSDQDVTILDSIAPMTPEQKVQLTVGANSGARLLTFDAAGAPVTVFDAALKFTEAQVAAITAASAKTADKFGRYEYKGAEEILSEFKWVRFLPLGLSVETVQEAVRFMQLELDAVGAQVVVSGSLAVDSKNPSYLRISLLDKTVGIKALREARGLSSPMLLVGDSLFGTRMADADMTKAAGAGSLTLAVGGLADPRIANVFVWPTKGAEASAEILAALGKIAPAAPDAATGVKVITWINIQSAISMSVFILTSIAYPMVVIPAVGAATYGVLMALGPLAAIALGPLSGMISTRFAPREGLAILSAMRAVLTVALPVMALTGMISFWPLLIASIANGWQFSLLMTSLYAYIRRFAITDPQQTRSWLHIGNLTTISLSIYFLLQVLLGSIGQIGGLVDAMSPMTPFWISAAVNAGLVGLNLWKIPKIANSVSNAVGVAQAAAEPLMKRAAFFLKKFWKEIALFAGSVGVYLWGLPLALPIIGTGLGSPLWMAGALVFWVSRTATFKSVMAEPKIRNALLLAALAAGLIYPFQNLAMPLIAASLGAKALIYGQLLGALFFGQLISNASMARLPEVRIPLLNKTVGAEKLLQVGVLALAGMWAGVRLFPGSILAAAGAVAIGMAVISVTSRLTHRGWIKFYGVGLMAAAGVALSWGFYPGIFVSVLLLGLFVGPFFSAINAYISGNSDPKTVSRTFGVSSSLFNALTSFGYGLMAASTKAYGDPAFPGALTPIIAVYLAAAVLFFFAPRWLPGLPEKSLRSPELKKPAA